MGLLLDSDLIPIGLDIFAGNESEKPYIRESVTRTKRRCGLANTHTIRVADKGLNCADNDVRLFCSRTGNCHDNAVAESFFATLKNEMYYRKSFDTTENAKYAVIEFIETYYNRKRPHSTIGNRIPAEVMDACFERTKPKPEGNQVSLPNAA